MLFMIPPLVVQLVSNAGSWILPALRGTAISGVTNDVNLWAAAAVLIAWGLVPAAVGRLVVQRRDVA